uniref:Uncharacterized protein n=1 Tax=Anguilla anguilla TaxID=7936 RepID=A0A0E9RZA0_ANGAN
MCEIILTHLFVIVGTNWKKKFVLWFVIQ